MRDGPRCKFTGILVFDMDKPFAAPGIGGIVVYVLAAVLTGYVLLVALSLMMAGGDGDALDGGVQERRFGPPVTSHARDHVQVGLVHGPPYP